MENFIFCAVKEAVPEAKMTYKMTFKVVFSDFLNENKGQWTEKSGIVTGVKNSPSSSFWQKLYKATALVIYLCIFFIDGLLVFLTL